MTTGPFVDLFATTIPGIGERRHDPRKSLFVAALVTITAVAACAFSTREKAFISWLPADENRIAVTAEIFHFTEPIGVRYEDSWQTEEYFLLKVGRRQSEMIYAEVNRAFTVALDYQMVIETMVSTWNFNSQQNLVWGPLGRINTGLGTWFYRTYENSDLQRSCVGFMLEWDQIYEDPQGRPGKLLFGYFCGAEGESLEDEAARTLIRGIRIGMAEKPSVRRYIAHETYEDQDARLFANGDLKYSGAMVTIEGYAPLKDTGNPRFPFRFARYYTMSSGGKIP